MAKIGEFLLTELTKIASNIRSYRIYMNMRYHLPVKDYHQKIDEFIAKVCKDEP